MKRLNKQIAQKIFDSRKNKLNFDDDSLQDNEENVGSDSDSDDADFYGIISTSRVRPGAKAKQKENSSVNPYDGSGGSFQF